MILVAPLELDLHEHPVLVALYAVELLAIEFLLSTHWVDRAILAVANRMSCVRGERTLVFGGHDMRLMGAYTRHVTGVIGLLSLVPSIGLDTLPIKVKRAASCDGDMHGPAEWWAIWGIMLLSVAVACAATALRRKVSE